MDAIGRLRRRIRWWLGAIAVLAGAGGSAAHVVSREIARPIPVPDVAPIDTFAALFDQTPTCVITTEQWQKVAMTVPRYQFLSDHTIWRRMHFEDWDRLPADVRAAGLRELLERYGSLMSAPSVWPTMSVLEWDRVPQPIRAMAFVGMIERWAASYQVGAAFGFDRRRVVQTVKAIAMSESWFDHRADYVNADGSVDIGLGGASGFARRAIRRLHAEGLCDFTLEDVDYYSPWHAARWLAFWFDLMLREAHGDLALAVRAYNSGIASALDGAGEDYLRAVERRRTRYFEGPSRSPTWRVLSEFRRRSARPAIAVHTAASAETGARH